MTTPAQAISRRALVGTALILAVLLAASLSLQVPFLSNDGPTRAYGAFVHNHYDDVARGYPRFVALNTPPTVHGFDVLFRALEPVLGWRLGMHVSVVLIAELWALAFFAFVVAVKRDRAVVGLLGFPLALQTSLYLGLFSFTCGTVVALAAVAVWLRAGRLVHVVTLVLLTLTALCHPFPLAAAGLFMGVAVLAREQRRAWPLALAKLAAASLPAVALVVAGSGLAELGPSDIVWDDVVERTLFIARGFQPGGIWRPLFALALAALGVIQLATAARARTASGVDRGFAMLALLFLIAAMVLPRDVGGWQIANIRPLPFAFVPLLALIDVDRLGNRRTIALIAFALYALSSFAWAASTGLRVKAATAVALSGLDDDTAEPRDWLPVITNPEGDVDGAWDIPRFAPLWHVADLYAMQRGGVTLFTQADAPSRNDTVRLHRDAGEVPADQEFARGVSAAPLEQRAGQLRKVLALAATHDGVVYVGAPGDEALLADAGFVASVVHPGLFVGHFVGCRGAVHVENVAAVANADNGAHVTDGGAASGLVIDVGWWPRKTPAVTLHVDGAALASDGSAASGVVDAPLERFGCGEVWLNVRGRRCREAGSSSSWGPVRGIFPHDGSGVLRCTLE